MDRAGSESQSVEAGEGRDWSGARPPRTSLRRAVEAATERVKEIIDAAERVAGEIHRDAEAEAERYLAERRREADRLTEEHRERLDQVRATLRGRVAALEAESEALIDDVERAIEQVGAPAPAPGAPEVPPDSAPTIVDGELRERALIRATQMAVGGADRDRIEGALRDELGIDDPAAIVDEILSR